MDSNLAQWVPLGAVSVVGVVLFSFYKNGWDDLAVYYSFRGVFPKNIIKRNSAELSLIADAGVLLRKGNTSSNLPIKIAGDPKGLYLQDIFFGRIFHPPLFIPWEDLTVSLWQIPKFMEKLVSSKALPMIFKIKRTPNVTFQISTLMAKKIEESSQGTWKEVSKIQNL